MIPMRVSSRRRLRGRRHGDGAERASDRLDERARGDGGARGVELVPAHARVRPGSRM